MADKTLKQKVSKLINTEMSIEHQEALKIIREYENLLADIKKDMKKKKITKVIVKEDNMTKVLEFKITKSMRVDTALMPTELKDKYKKETEVWKKNVCVLEDNEEWFADVQKVKSGHILPDIDNPNCK